MANPKMCSVCGRAMIRNQEDDKWECNCGNEQPIFYGRSDNGY